MKLSRIKEILRAEVLWGEELLEDIEVSNACGADLMSDILADNKTKAILLTGLTHRQIIQTAGMSDFAAIVFVRGKLPTKDVIKLAQQEKLPLLRTKYPLYETCGALYEDGLKGDMIRLSKDKHGDIPTKAQEELKSINFSYDIRGDDFNNAGKATEQAKKVLKQIGIEPSAIRRVSIAAYEAEMNIVIHAYKGKLSFDITPKYIEIIADDTGPGIDDTKIVLQEGFSTASERIRELGFGAGMGLPNMRKFSDIFEINSVVGRGTKVRMVVNL